MDKFIAIPVGQGDAFYLQRNDFSILVDGGLSRSGFPALFQKSTNTERVNIVVCTHNDADHANGILGFLEAGFECDEVWLPGRWLDALPHILKPFVEVLDELERNIEQVVHYQNTDGINTDSSLLEKINKRETHAQSETDKPVEDITLGIDGWPSSLAGALEQSALWKLLPTHPHLLFYFKIKCHYLGDEACEFLWEAIKAANRIREIALAAFHRGIPVRWFEYDPSSSSGGNSYLMPLNAKKVACVKPLIGTLLHYLSLSISNEESLVFWSPCTGQAPGVLFNADSDLANVKLPSDHLADALATSPHHGSEANANAYVEVIKAAGTSSSSILWVRSDCRSTSRPGKFYLGLPPSKRSCTMCRQSTGSYTIKTAISFDSMNGFWHRLSAACTCK